MTYYAALYNSVFFKAMFFLGVLPWGRELKALLLIILGAETRHCGFDKYPHVNNPMGTKNVLTWLTQ